MTANTNVIGNPVITGVRVTEGDEHTEAQEEGRLGIPLSGEAALRGLLHVEPQSEPAEDKK